MKHGIELLEELKLNLKRRKQIQLDRQSRIDCHETTILDCATSIRIDSLNNSIDMAKISILENNGLMDFDCLLDSSNNVISEDLINGKYGLCWLVKDQYKHLYGSFVGEPKKVGDSDEVSKLKIVFVEELSSITLVELWVDKIGDILSYSKRHNKGILSFKERIKEDVVRNLTYFVYEGELDDKITEEVFEEYFNEVIEKHKSLSKYEK